MKKRFSVVICEHIYYEFAVKAKNKEEATSIARSKWIQNQEPTYTTSRVDCIEAYELLF